MIQKPFTLPTRYISCPACGKTNHQVSHLPVGCKTAWYCDECGVYFHLHAISEDRVEVTADPVQRKDKTLVTLRSEGPVTLIVEGMSFVGSDASENLTEHDEYFYNEHTCPTNYMGRVEKVIDETGDEDPHGVFKYVKTEPWRRLD